MADKVEDGEKLFSSARNADVKSPEAAKFIPARENKNGISPISVDSMKATFTGLTKEELMKYANDPFWVRTRLFLFVLFWIVWLAMLLGAIYIIVVTPKCKEDPPPVWWQKSPMYIIDVAKLIRDSPSPENHFVLGKSTRLSIYLLDNLSPFILVCLWRARIVQVNASIVFLS